MNDPSYRSRLLESRLGRCLATFPVVVLTGARQTGKSTLAQQGPIGPPRDYVTLDDPEMQLRATDAPAGLVAGRRPITLDEVQRVPDLLHVVKQAVDRRKSAGRFLLTGSASLLLLEKVAESLAGRAVHLTLLPLTRREQTGKGAAGCWTDVFETEVEAWPDVLLEEGGRVDWKPLARTGGYPTPALELADAESRRLWFGGYTQTYLERDLRDILAVASLPDFRRLMRACCLRLGNLVNQTDLGRDVGLSQATVHRHLNALEVSHQLVRIPGFAVNRTKRLIKSPKAYWSDTGLAMHLAGERDPRGAHLENVVLTDLLAWRESVDDTPQITYWRTSGGDEVDFVVEWQGRALPVEVKSSARPRVRDARGLAAFLAEYDDLAAGGLLLHTGSQVTWLDDRILAVPWWRVL